MLTYNMPKVDIPDIRKKVVLVINDEDGVTERIEKIHPVDLHNVLLCNGIYINNQPYEIIYKYCDIDNDIYYIHLQIE